MSGQSLSEIISRNIAEFVPEALPASTADATSMALLDATGVMLAASGLSEDVQPFIALAKSTPGPCQVLGTGLRTAPHMAALANGAMAHALDFEDAFDRAALHPNAALVPAALAIAEYTGGISGSRFIAALAVGCDLVCRMGLALQQPVEQKGWYHPLLFSAFGATAAASYLLGLNWRQTRDALSLTLCGFSAPGAIGKDRLTTLRATREGFAAEAAVKSVLLAKAGVRGFEEPLEGKGGFYDLYADGSFDTAELLNQLGTRFHGESLSFKPWPACRATHTFIELALQARQAPSFDVDSIESITVDIGTVQQMLVEPLERKSAPQTLIDAKFSIPFTLALALIRGRVGLEDFSEASLQNPEILDLAAKVQPRSREAWGREQATAGALAIRYRNGEDWQGELMEALGHPFRPMSTDALLEKFDHCAGYAKCPPADRELANQLLSLTEKPSINSVLCLMANGK